jgi:anaerobic magnesium-protoporphyrin IX monomethyl ester cyclase
LKEKRLRIGFFLQFGYPGETFEDIQATIRMVLELMPDELGISISYPLPGTKFYEKVKGQLSKKKNWRDSDDLAMMFESTFKVEYYRQLHRYVHSVYRRKKGYNNLKKIFQNPLDLNYRDLRSGLSTFYYIPTTFTQYFKLKKLATA